MGYYIYLCPDSILSRTVFYFIKRKADKRIMSAHRFILAWDDRATNVTGEPEVTESVLKALLVQLYVDTPEYDEVKKCLEPSSSHSGSACLTAPPRLTEKWEDAVSNDIDRIVALGSPVINVTQLYKRLKQTAKAHRALRRAEIKWCDTSEPSGASEPPEGPSSPTQPARQSEKPVPDLVKPMKPTLKPVPAPGDRVCERECLMTVEERMNVGDVNAGMLRVSYEDGGTIYCDDSNLVKVEVSE